jgi:cytochrome c biogenesis protein CcmG/thiol:disulfide interchange protein DsbE
MANAQPTAESPGVESETSPPSERVDGDTVPTSDAVASPPAGGLRAGKFLFAALVVVALAALLWPRGEGSAAPGGTLVDGGGRPVPLGPQMGKVTLLHFWASWCPPCRPELPQIVKLSADMAGERDLKVVLVAVEDQPAAAVALAGPVAGARLLFDPKWDVAHRYGTSQLPETYLIVDGRVVRKYVGGVEWGDPQIRAALAATLVKARR